MLQLPGSQSINRVPRVRVLGPGAKFFPRFEFFLSKFCLVVCVCARVRACVCLYIYMIKVYNQIDHILVDRSHCLNVCYVRSMRGAEIESDHFLMRTKVRLKIKKC